MEWNCLGIFLVISLVLGLVGFYKEEYFGSIGYGFSVAGIGVALVVLRFMKAYDVSWPHYILFALLILYGIRLATFKLASELENDTYRQKTKKMPIYMKVVRWLVVSLLCVGLTSPVFFTVYNYGYPGGWLWIGVTLGGLGLVFEILMDIPKVREFLEICPKQVGEILFWTGILVSSLDALSGFGQWIIPAISYACVVFIRIMEIKRSK